MAVNAGLVALVPALCGVIVPGPWTKATLTRLPAYDYDISRATNAARAAEAGVHADTTAPASAAGKSALSAGRAVRRGCDRSATTAAASTALGRVSICSG